MTTRPVPRHGPNCALWLHPSDTVCDCGAVPPQRPQHTPRPTQATAYLMVAVDTRVTPPTMVGWRIMSEDNPTTGHGCRWLRVSESYGADYQTAHDVLYNAVTDFAAPDHAWVGWVNRLPRL